jgi:hypothetical protein
MRIGDRYYVELIEAVDPVLWIAEITGRPRGGNVTVVWCSGRLKGRKARIETKSLGEPVASLEIPKEWPHE